MRQLLRTLVRLLPRVLFLMFLGQLAIMIGLTGRESIRRKKRRTNKFPISRPTPIAVGDNQISVYTFGKDLYRDMLAAIESATESIYFETYIWKADEVGEQFKDALAQAADRGVQVYLIWDDFANLVVPRKFFEMPTNINVMRHPALPAPWSPRSWGRDHRKLLVVDRNQAFIGGYNIGASYATAWRDTHARVVGPAAAELENAFIDFWNLHSQERRVAPLSDHAKRKWNPELVLHRNTPRIQVYPIRNMYLEAIDRASERIWLTHAYLIPDDGFVSALQQAVARGVDVRIIIPAHSNHIVADWLSRSYYTRLLRSGIRLLLYQGAMVHSKTATIDGQWATIGTANLDRLSLWGNYEVNLEMINPQVAEHLEDVFQMDESNCLELTLAQWQQRSLIAKITEVYLSPTRPFF